MNTGICKGLLFGLALAITGCSEGEALGFLSEGLQPDAVTQAKPFTQVEMVQGAVTLVPPSGFCVDPKTVTQSFALMARCDVLGGRGGARDAPLGLITVSVAPAGGSAAVSVANVFASDDGSIVAQKNVRGHAFAQLRSDAPSDGLSKIHWHAVERINGFDVALSLYAPEGSDALNTRGASILAQLLDGTQSATVAKDVAVRTLRPRAKPKKLF